MAKSIPFEYYSDSIENISTSNIIKNPNVTFGSTMAIDNVADWVSKNAGDNKPIKEDGNNVVVGWKLYLVKNSDKTVYKQLFRFNQVGENLVKTFIFNGGGDSPNKINLCNEDYVKNNTTSININECFRYSENQKVYYSEEREDINKNFIYWYENLKDLLSGEYKLVFVPAIEKHLTLVVVDSTFAKKDEGGKYVGLLNGKNFEELNESSEGVIHFNGNEKAYATGYELNISEIIGGLVKTGYTFKCVKALNGDVEYGATSTYILDEYATGTSIAVLVAEFEANEYSLTISNRIVEADNSIITNSVSQSTIKYDSNIVDGLKDFENNLYIPTGYYFKGWAFG